MRWPRGIDIDHGRTYRLCPACEGAGWVLIVPREEFLARRERALALYPDCAAPMDIPNPSLGVVIQDLSTGQMIVIPDEPAEEGRPTTLRRSRPRRRPTM